MPCACQAPVPKYPETADWGPSLWTLLHGLGERAGQGIMAADEVREWQKFIKATGDMLPCDHCRAHYARFFAVNPPTQLNTVAVGMLRPWVRSWFYTLHNEVNVENKKPSFDFSLLAPTYAKVNFTEMYLRLEPIMKKAIQLSGVSLLKWTTWVHSFKMLRSILSV